MAQTAKVVGDDKIIFDETDGRKGALKKTHVFWRVENKRLKPLIEGEFKAAVEAWELRNPNRVSDVDQPSSTPVVDQPDPLLANVTEATDRNTEPIKDPKPVWIGYKNSRLSHYWKAASTDEQERVQAAVDQHKKDAAAKSGKDRDAPWRGDSSVAVDERDRLDKALKRQA